MGFAFAQQPPGEPDESLQHAPTSVRDVCQAIAAACLRLPELRRADKSHRVDQLIKAGAWTDAVLALIELELPAWTVRRLIYEDGEWICSLSRQPGLPVEFDDSVDGSHAALPLAILRAFLAVLHEIDVVHEAVSANLRVRPTQGVMVCCDNFS